MSVFETFLSIISSIVTATLNPERNKGESWDISLIFSDLIHPGLFKSLTDSGVKATIISSSGKVLNSKPFLMYTRRQEGQRINISFERKLSLKTGDKIIFYYRGRLLREITITNHIEI